jgi:hypothetical protein
MINESFRRAGPPAMRKRTAAPANPTRLPTNAFVIMALRMMGTSTCTPLCSCRYREGLRSGR